MSDLPPPAKVTASALALEGVEWLPEEGGAGLLRVWGRWSTPEDARELPVLSARTGGTLTRFRSLPDVRDRLRDEPGAWRGAYVVPAGVLDARPELWLEWEGGLRFEFDLAPPESERGGEVIDRAVLAERRARRAEAAEREAAQAADEALRAVRVLEARGADLEGRLAGLEAERDQLEARLRAAQAGPSPEELAALRAALAEAEGQAEAQRRALAGALAAAAGLRAQAREWRLRFRTSELARTSDSVRLAVLEAERATNATRERELRGAEARLDQLESEAARGGEELRAAQDALAERDGELEAAEAARSSLEARVAELEGALDAGRRAAREAGGALTAARAQLTAAEGALRAAVVPRATPSAPVPARSSAPTATAASSDVVANLEAAAAALRERIPAPEGPATPEPAAESPEPSVAPEPPTSSREPQPATEPPAAVEPAPPPTPPGPRWLRGALVRLAVADPASAGRLLAGLLPAQGAMLAGPLEYDLTLVGVGTFAVRIESGTARVQALSAPRSWRQAELHLRAEPLALAQLVAGVRRHVGVFRGPVRVRGRNPWKVRRLAPVAQAPLTLADALNAGARFEPELVLSALPHLIPPAWTRGHRFTVAVELTEQAPAGGYLLTVADGAPLSLAPTPAEAPATARVRLTGADFDTLMRSERLGDALTPHAAGDPAAGAALTALGGWLDRARGLVAA